MNDLEFIKKFSAITIKGICKKLGVCDKNLYSGRTTKENITKVRNQLEYEIRKLIFISSYEKLKQEEIEVIE